MELFKVDTLEEARKKLQEVFPKEQRRQETVAIEDSLGRVLSEDVFSSEDVPCFDKSTVDGYAVRAVDTQGAGESIPVFLHQKGEVLMGKNAEFSISPGECAYVPTGGMIPEGADAMVMVEYSEPFLGDIAIYHSASEGRNIIRRGEDVVQGSKILSAGTTIRSQEIGVLASVGIKEVKVYSPIKIAVISTGDELIGIDEELHPGQVRESNAQTLRALALEAGMEVVFCDRVKDEPETFMKVLEECKKECDFVASSGGSSQGKKDMSLECLEKVASEGILTHGIALKPGKPTILSYDKESHTVFFGLPGHPVAAMMVFILLAKWLAKDITNHQDEMRNVTAEMGCNVAGAPGRTTCLLVSLEKQNDKLVAWPIYGKSGVLMSLVNSDGYVLMDLNLEGLQKGEKVEVIPL